MHRLIILLSVRLQGRTALHAAESHLSSGSVKAEQARSVALGAWEALGLLPPPSPHAARQKPFNEHSSRNRERRPKSASPDRCDPVSTHSSVRASKPSSRSNPQSTATESPASGSSAGHSGSSHAHSSSNYDSDSGSQLQRTREAVNVMRPAALENDHSPWPSRNPSGSHGKSNYRSPVDLEWDAAFEKEAVALKEARELAQDEVALAELRRQRAALDSSFGANEVARQAANGLANHISSGRSNSSSTGGGDFSDTGSQHSRTSSGHGSGTSSSRSEKRAYKSKSVAAMVTSLASREAKLEQKVLDRKAANRARFLAAAVARTKAQASATAAAAGAVNVTSPQSADTLESNLSNNNNNNGNNGSRRPFIPSPAARDDAESQALAAHYFGLAGELEDEDHLAEAADAYAASLQHQPAQAEGHYNLAIILDALGRFDESVSSSLSALALNPQWPEAHYNLGQTYDSIGDIRRAVACYEAAVALKPEWDDAVHNLAVAKHELAAQPELEPLEPQQQQQQHELRPPSTPERSTQAHSSNRFISPTTPGPSSSTPVAYTTPQPLPPGVLGGANSSMGSGNTSGAQQLFSSPSSTSSPAPPPMYTPFGSTQYSNSNTNASSALFNSAGAFYDNHSDDDSENPDEGGWDLESATSSKSGTASDAGSQHSDVSFWSAASHASKATSHRSSSNKHSHGRSVSIGRHGSSPLPAMPPTPPRDQPTGRGFSASYDEAGDLQRRNSALGAALDEASENDDDNPMPDKKNCLLS